MVTTERHQQPDPDPSAGIEAHRWLEAHRGELGSYAGKWLAIGPTGVLASGDSPDAALESPAAQAISDPLVFFVSDPALKSLPRIA